MSYIPEPNEIAVMDTLLVALFFFFSSHIFLVIVM